MMEYSKTSDGPESYLGEQWELMVDIADHEAGHLLMTLLINDPDVVMYFPKQVHIAKPTHPTLRDGMKLVADQALGIVSYSQSPDTTLRERVKYAKPKWKIKKKGRSGYLNAKKIDPEVILEFDTSLLARIILKDLGGIAAEHALEGNYGNRDIRKFTESKLETGHDTYKSYQIIQACFHQLNHEAWLDKIVEYHKRISEFLKGNKKLINHVSNFCLIHNGEIHDDLTVEVEKYLETEGYTTEEFDEAKKAALALIDSIAKELDKAKNSPFGRAVLL